MKRTTLLRVSMTAALMLASLGALLGTHNSARAAFPGENGDIAFLAQGDIYRQSVDGSSYTRLTLIHSDFVKAPSWSPDGEKIAYVDDGVYNNDELWVMDADGTDQVQLTNSPGYNRQPAWFPGGRRIAVNSNRKGDSDIYVLTLNAARDDVVRVEQLTNRDSGDRQPAVSPSGKRLAFVSNRNGAEAAIYSMRTGSAEGPNGHNRPLQLTGNGEGSDPDTEPDWAPSGQKIVFTSQRTDTREIYVMDANGEREQALTGSPSTENFQPVFSPDGQKIAFVRHAWDCFDSDCIWDFDGVIWTMDADGSNPTWAIIGGTPYFDGYTIFREPTWQPLPNATVGTGP